MNIIFYNDFHNGDLHYCREFIKDIMCKVSANFYFAHKCNTETSKDIPNLNYKNIMEVYSIRDYNSISITNINDNIYINTWMGQKHLLYYKDTMSSIYTVYKIFTDVYKQLNIEINEIEYYIPEIDKCYLNIQNIDNFLNNHKNKKVLISNGDVKSGQSNNFNFNNIIIKLAAQYQNIDFILTDNKSKINMNNIYYTNDIINQQYDLNEVSYISTYCDVIVGRASGTYSFSFVKDNLFNPNKTFIGFSHWENESIFYKSNICKQLWYNNYDENFIIEKIKENL